MSKRGLGKGLAQLGVNELLATALEPETSDQGTKQVPITQLVPGKYQPRGYMDQTALVELAQSIQAQGIIQPIVVRPQESGYEIIAGERRWRAAQIAGLVDVPVVVRAMDDTAALAVGLIENIQRQDLNIVDQANALSRLAQEFEMTHQEIADVVGKSRATVTNLLRLLKLDSEILNLLQEGQLEMGHARALLGLTPEQQHQYAHLIVEKGLSVRAAEALIQQKQQANSTPRMTSQTLLSADLERLQQGLMDRLNTGVHIQAGQKGRGKIVIRYDSLMHLDQILDRIQ